jgi:hypothetical protein
MISPPELNTARRRWTGVATDRQIAANRANSKKSTGPKSRGGKRRASQNAHIHGLAGRSPIDPDWTERTEQQAREIVDSTHGRIGLSHARSIAQAQQDLLRARSISTALVAKTLASPIGGATVSSSSDRSPLDTDGAGAVELAVPLLRVLDRYEHRALARRDRAIRLCFEG